jgi:hypothetical protein
LKLGWLMRGGVFADSGNADRGRVKNPWLLVCGGVIHREAPGPPQPADSRGHRRERGQLTARCAAHQGSPGVRPCPGRLAAPVWLAGAGLAAPMS